MGGLIFLFGIVIGSFLNVCIFSIPIKEDIVFGRSHCMSCGNVLKWYELIPVISYLCQKGKCRKCGTKISWQYPAVEILNGILYIWIFWLYGASLQSMIYCLCCSVLIVISGVDLKTYEIPFGCNLLIGGLGIANLALNPDKWIEYVIGFFTVSGFFLLVHLITRGKGIGLGDMKLMAAAGLLLGWKKAILALMIASIVGSVIHLSLMKWKNKSSMLAFGPYLALGIGISILYGEKIINWYLRLFIF